ncbi:hypothetical protein A3K86_06905 [Photobacterium jeanii]|uniref:Flagellar hook-length control protein-like C-terminal domain-containing protein n=1 Tax=Photobacterium jeanii TaxID=858640 RepID=A0A178KMN5_9GAMM|nr:flagellar hook-length control protein FliK [Photobacterium jeanii]OAN18609.1 hypothetical protein A3K86_06905 [Photobacterium jeanii]PST91711.1 flagellar hook-length control protein FliK [Photobacterium jeanii]
MSLSNLMPFNFSSASKATAQPAADSAKLDATGKMAKSDTANSGDGVKSEAGRDFASDLDQAANPSSLESSSKKNVTTPDEVASDQADVSETGDSKTTASQVTAAEGESLVSDGELSADAMKGQDQQVSSTNESASASDKKQAMDEGDAFLKQLDAANKQLPQQGSSPQASSQQASLQQGSPMTGEQQAMAAAVSGNGASKEEAGGKSLPAGSVLAADKATGQTAGQQGELTDDATQQNQLAHVFSPAASAQVGQNTVASAEGVEGALPNSDASQDMQGDSFAASSAVAAGALQAGSPQTTGSSVASAMTPESAANLATASNATATSQAVAGSGQVAMNANGVTEGALIGSKLAGGNVADSTLASDVTARTNAAMANQAAASTAHIPWASTTATDGTRLQGSASSAALAGSLAGSFAGETADSLGAEGQEAVELRNAAMLAGGMHAVAGDESQELTRATAQDGAQPLTATAGSQTMQQMARAEAVAQAQQTPIQLSKDQGGDELAEKVNIMMSKNLKHVDIRLDPPELGKVQIKLSMNQDQASLQFTAANSQTRELLEHSMPRLRELLHQQGVQLAQTSVQQDTSRQASNGQNFAGQQGQQTDGQGGSGRGQQGGSQQGDGHWGDGESLEMYATPSNDGVDYYA